MDADGIWRKGFQFGDWLDFRGMALIPSPVTNPELVGTAFASYSAQLTSKTAHVLGRVEDAERYATFARETAAAFCREFVSGNGRVGPNSQTAYVLALHFDLLPEAQRAAAAARLAEIVKGANYHLTTGFVGTPYLCHVLSRFGHLDVAYELLNQESFPSWLYPVNRGATTIWERWDGIKPDGAFQDAGMNSFNHYAYGAIGEWLYRVVAGIEIDPAAPGYKHALIQPQPGGGLDNVSASLETPYGQLAVAWRLSDWAFAIHVTIPANMRATVRIPAQSVAEVRLDGAPLPADAVIADGVATVTLGSGNYALVSSALNRERAHRNVLHIAGRLDKYNALGDLLRNPRAKEVIVSRMGADPSQSPMFGFIANAPLAQLSAQMPHLLPPEKLDEIDAELRKLGG
jgi:alpha-L-rhamnosidase